MAKKAGLGRGLDALIPGVESATAETAENFVAVEKIQPNPLQPRGKMDEDELQDLAASIREHGILQPLIVTNDPGTDAYVLIAGERRLRAAKMAGLDIVPVIIREVSEQQRLELALIENVQRANLNPVETAEAYQKLADEFNLTQEEISEQVGKNRVTVANTLRLLKLTPAGRQALLGGQISEGHARSILGLPTAQAQNAILQTVISRELNVRQTEELVRKFAGVRPVLKGKSERSADLVELETQLRDKLGTRVNLNPTAKGGTLVIHYYSDEELDSLIRMILK